ncbi:MAG: DUF1292 domain-containing protein [Solobacterium sp.]|nr:DUF1292 domain-containing protein [Solobacterium sp.]
MSEQNNMMTIVNEDGVEMEVEILMTFTSPDGKKNFVLIGDPDEPDTAYPFTYNEDGEMEEVTDPEDFELCSEVYSAYFGEESENAVL